MVSHMRRRPGAVLPLERDILSVAVDLRFGDPLNDDAEDGWFHGYWIANELAGLLGRKTLVSHGTLYRCLRLMAERGWLTSRIEGAEEAAHHSGPPRRYYRIEPEGVSALRRAGRADQRRELEVSHGLLVPKFGVT